MEARHGMEAGIREACRVSPCGADLLVAAFAHALRSRNRSSTCTPCPIFNGREKDFEALESALQRLPWLRDVHGSLEQVPLEDLRLLHWLLKFRRTLQLATTEDFLQLLPAKSSHWCLRDGVDQMSKCILPDAVVKVCEPQAEGTSRFDSVKSQFGSVLAYHGTGFENLHSILRCGLLSFSKTDMEKNGSMYGKGIYFSTDPRVALTFSSASSLRNAWPKAYFAGRLRCILLCEIADGEDVLRAENASDSRSRPGRSYRDDLGTYVVVQSGDLVKLRYILLYREPDQAVKNWLTYFYLAVLVGIALLASKNR